MKSSVPQFNKLLQEAWPAISTIGWASFGKNIVAYDDNGVPKHTGVLSHVVSDGPSMGCNTQALGFLPRPETSAKIVVIKVRLLLASPKCKASMELRNPSVNEWGGGIRSSVNPEEIWALTGLPEIGDHLLCAQVMRECELLTKGDWELITDANTIHMIAAREFVGMSIDQYMALKKLIFNIVSDALTVSKFSY
ncbi:TPA: hypothetical protein DEP94_02975 [Candidatus Nomurabacteria bacterium]|nr:hypothetical protein [Candidatus Nomurabacteria bacterium]